MKRKFALILSLVALLSTMLTVRFNGVEVKAPDGLDPSKIYGIEMIWNNSMSVNDVAVSRDGNYIAAVNNTGLYYFAWNISNPKWWYSGTTFLSVAISGDGEYVVIGDNSGYLRYFNNSRATTGERSNPTWTSTSLFGAVERGTLDMSDSGDYVVVGGTGPSVWYYAECTQRSGVDEAPTWSNMLMVYDIRAVDMSSDGKYVAVGGERSSSVHNGFVAFYEDSDIAEINNVPSWIALEELNYSKCYVVDLAVSNDGYAVVAVTSYFTTLHYWANATNLTGDPEASWNHYQSFACVDISSDGNEVIAGSSDLSSGELYFWSDARSLSGWLDANWTRLKGMWILDVAISDDGEIISATAQIGVASNYKAYFLKRNGEIIEEFDLPQYSPILSMSGNGIITAVAGPGPDSLYVFQTLVDKTPPLIENVHQQPANDSVYPEDEVMVYANVTDDLSGVKQVILNYTYTNSTGTWHGTVIMDPLELDSYNGTIPRLPYCTNVTYVIIAEDNFNNIITTEEMGQKYKYHVIPEFSLQLVLPILAASTLLTMLIRKRKQI
jgi:WD40 repeat protein